MTRWHGKMEELWDIQYRSCRLRVRVRATRFEGRRVRFISGFCVGDGWQKKWSDADSIRRHIDKAIDSLSFHERIMRGLS